MAFLTFYGYRNILKLQKWNIFLMILLNHHYLVIKYLLICLIFINLLRDYSSVILVWWWLIWLRIVFIWILLLILLFIVFLGFRLQLLLLFFHRDLFTILKSLLAFNGTFCSYKYTNAFPLLIFICYFLTLNDCIF